MLCGLLPSMGKERTLPYLCFKANIKLKPKYNKENMRKENYKPIFLMNKDGGNIKQNINKPNPKYKNETTS